MAFQPSSPNGARLRLIKISGVLFAVLKARQKRHRPLLDRTSGLNFDTALYPHRYKTYSEITDEQTKKNKEKNYT
jgi:hypothetical protein